MAPSHQNGAEAPRPTGGSPWQCHAAADYGTRIAAAKIRLKATQDPNPRTSLAGQVRELEFARTLTESAG